MPAPATMLANRVRAPPSARMAVAENDPPTGIPWKTPVVTLASPCPVKSPDGSDLLPSGLGNAWVTAAPGTSPTMASTPSARPDQRTAPGRRTTTGPGRSAAGASRGMSPMSAQQQRDVGPVEDRRHHRRPRTSPAGSPSAANRRAGSSRSSRPWRQPRWPAPSIPPGRGFDSRSMVWVILFVAVRCVPGEVAQLTEDDRQADRMGEGRHRRSGTKRRMLPSPQQTRYRHERPDEECEDEQGVLGGRFSDGETSGTTATISAIASRLDAQRHRAGEERAENPPIIYAYTPVTGLRAASVPMAMPSGTLSTASVSPEVMSFLTYRRSKSFERTMTGVSKDCGSTVAPGSYSPDNFLAAARK